MKKQTIIIKTNIYMTEIDEELRKSDMRIGWIGELIGTRTNGDTQLYDIIVPILRKSEIVDNIRLILPRKYISLKSDDSINELYNENVKLRKKLKKIRKEKTRWQKKYLEIYNYVKMMEDTTYVTTKDPMWERIKLGLGVPPIDQSLYDEDGEPRKFGIRYERRGW